MTYLRRITPTRRQAGAGVVIVATLLFTLLTVASAYEGSSIYDNIAPEPQAREISSDKHPFANYGLDYHVDDVIPTFDGTGSTAKDFLNAIAPGSGYLLDTAVDHVGIPKGFHPERAPDNMAQKFAAWGWDAERFFSGLAITLFSFAMGIDIINGTNGALRPVSDAVSDLYASLGGQWLGFALACLGLWIGFQMLGRNFTHTISTVLKSLACAMLAMLIIAQPGWTIGGTWHLFHEASNAVMGEITGAGGNAEDAGATALRNALVRNPWVVLEFGGLVHCVDAHDKPTKPFGPDCQAGKKIDNRKKYADRWLKAGPANGKERALEYAALLNGKTPSAKEINDAGMPANSFDDYHLSAADKPAADAMQAQGAGERLVMVAVIALALLPAWAVVGGVSIGIIVAAAIALAWFCVTPIAMLAVVAWPGPGTVAFMYWGKQLLEALSRVFWYGLILAVALTVSGALMNATAYLGWELAFVAFAGFWWFLLFKHKRIYMGVVGAIGHRTNMSPSVGQRLNNAYRTQRALRGTTGTAIGAGVTGARASMAVGKVAAQPVGAAARGTRQAVRTTKENIGHLAAPGFASQIAGTAGLHDQALRALEGEHRANSALLRKEQGTRDRAADLRTRKQAGDLEGGGGLSPREQKTLAHLDAKRMPNKQFDALATTVNDVERREKETGTGFTPEMVAQRTTQLAAERDQAASNGGPSPESTSPSDGRRRLDMLRERLRAQRTPRETVHKRSPDLEREQRYRDERDATDGDLRERALPVRPDPADGDRIQPDQNE